MIVEMVKDNKINNEMMVIQIPTMDAQMCEKLKKDMFEMLEIFLIQIFEI